MYCSTGYGGSGGLYRIIRVGTGAKVNSAVSVGLLLEQLCTVAYQ